MMSSALTSHDSFFFFFFNDTATTEIYTLSLHDALPISGPVPGPHDRRLATGWHPRRDRRGRRTAVNLLDPAAVDRLRRGPGAWGGKGGAPGGCPVGGLGGRGGAPPGGPPPRPGPRRAGGG